MSSARGQANQCLYLAKILLAAWQRDLAEERVAASVLTHAYLPAVREHLCRAYGWFLLEVSRPDALPAAPPSHTGELPDVVAGKALPPEIRECAQLESSGWLAVLLAEESSAPIATSSGNLAVSAGPIGHEEASNWPDQLQALFDRMGDSLDEY